MIRYDKGWWGLKNFTRMYGSAFPRALPFSVTAAVLAGVLSYFFAETLDSAFLDPYPFQTFAFVAGFMVVFRCDTFPARLSSRQCCKTQVKKEPASARVTTKPSNCGELFILLPYWKRCHAC